MVQNRRGDLIMNDIEKKYYQTKRTHLSHAIAIAVLDLAIVELQAEGKPITDEGVRQLADEYMTAMAAAAIGSSSEFFKSITAGVEEALKIDE